MRIAILMLCCLVFRVQAITTNSTPLFILVRSGVAFEFELTAETQGRSHPLTGVFTWAGIDLDQPGQHKHRVWLDLKGTLAEFGSEGELAARIYFEQSSASKTYPKSTS
jgi:hypothetical protein